MWITRKELNRRIEIAVETEIKRRDREQWERERYYELEKGMCRFDERLSELENALKINHVHGTVYGCVTLAELVKSKC